MFYSARTLYVTLGLVTILVMGLYFIQYNLIHTPPLQQRILPKQDYIDEYVYNAKMRRFNKDGRLIQDFHLTEWTHFHHAGIAYFVEPYLILHSPTAIWSIRSLKGQTLQAHLGDKLNAIQLSDQVNIHHTTQNKPSWRLTTERLEFLLNENRSRTSAPVRIEQSSLIIDAIGAEADLDKGTIQLNEKVKTIYSLHS
ncbi:MAG: LPS export ABC transporter periplasmic protein LptC [Gammaproteobacteria bacterium]